MCDFLSLCFCRVCLASFKMEILTFSVSDFLQTAQRNGDHLWNRVTLWLYDWLLSIPFWIVVPFPVSCFPHKRTCLLRRAGRRFQLWWTISTIFIWSYKKRWDGNANGIRCPWYIETWWEGGVGIRQTPCSGCNTVCELNSHGDIDHWKELCEQNGTLYELFFFLLLFKNTDL